MRREGLLLLILVMGLGGLSACADCDVGSLARGRVGPGATA